MSDLFKSLGEINTIGVNGVSINSRKVSHLIIDTYNNLWQNGLNNEWQRGLKGYGSASA